MSRGRSWRDGIDRDFAAAHFFGYNMGQRFHAGFGGGMDTIGFLVESNQAGRKINDPAATAWPSFARRWATAAPIPRDEPVTIAQRILFGVDIGISQTIEGVKILRCHLLKTGHDAPVYWYLKRV